MFLSQMTDHWCESSFADEIDQYIKPPRHRKRVLLTLCRLLLGFLSSSTKTPSLAPSMPSRPCQIELSVAPVLKSGCSARRHHSLSTYRAVLSCIILQAGREEGRHLSGNTSSGNARVALPLSDLQISLAVGWVWPHR